MILILKLIILTVIIVMGLKIVMSKEMLLEDVGDYFERKVDEGYKVFDLFICPWCMATLCSLIAHAFAFGLGILPLEFNWQLVIRWPIVLCGASFIGGNLWNCYEAINRWKEKSEAEAEYFNSLIEK